MILASNACSSRQWFYFLYCRPCWKITKFGGPFITASNGRPVVFSGVTSSSMVVYVQCVKLSTSNVVGWPLTAKRSWVLYPLLFLQVLTVVANIYLAAVIGIAFDGQHSSTNDILNVSRNLLPTTMKTFTVWMIGTLVLDICMTVTLVFVLWRCKTGSLQSDKIVHRIIIIAWESAVLPSTCTIVATALYHAILYTYDHVVILLVLQTGKLYTLGMLRSLNMRANLRQKFRSVDLGGRISLPSVNCDTYSAHTSTANNSDQCSDSPKSTATENLELAAIRHPCHGWLGVTEEWSSTDAYGEISSTVGQEDGVPRNRVAPGMA
ncbi:hypothetical protein AX14_005654 [Amanita brunnescens Koide BX004]|nr:hypothetical protein AX14_005654 [Amanita brunnescens Koide BX004]